MFVCDMLSCLLLAALWSPAGKGLTYVMFSCVFCHFPIWCPGSGVVLGCIDSWSLPTLLLLYIVFCSIFIWVCKYKFKGECYIIFINFRDYTTCSFHKTWHTKWQHQHNSSCPVWNFPRTPEVKPGSKL